MTLTNAESTGRPRDRSLPAFVAGLVVLGVAYLACLDEVAGLFVDDGWYIVLGKALASGAGYTLINAPVPGVLPFYPPGLPALLAVVMLVAPDFPATVPYLKGTSVAAMLLGAMLTRHYFVRYRDTSSWVASGLALLLPANAFLHFLLTSAVLSEGLFFSVQMAAIIAVERYARGDAVRIRGALDLLAAAALVVATGLVRSLGLVLAPAAILYVLVRRGLRRSVLLAFAIALLAAPWQLYSRMNAPTESQRAMVNDVITTSYGEQFTMRLSGHAEFGRVSGLALAARVAQHAGELAGRALGHLYVQPLVDPKDAYGVVSLLATLTTLVGLLATTGARATLAEIYVPATIAILLPFGSSPDRYLLPLLPLLAFHLLVGVRVATLGASRVLRMTAQRARESAASLAAATLAALLLINMAGLARDVADTLGFAPGRRMEWRSAFAENLRVIAWARDRLPRRAVIATHNPAMVYLYSGNPTVGTSEPATNVAHWRSAGARLWVDNTVAAYRFPNMEQSGFVPLMITERLGLGVYRIPPKGATLR